MSGGWITDELDEAVAVVNEEVARLEQYARDTRSLQERLDAEARARAFSRLLVAVDAGETLESECPYCGSDLDDDW